MTDKRFSQVIIWGHTTPANTMYYIHEAFYRAFSHMGYKTHWIPNMLGWAVAKPPSLFLVEGQQDRHIPVRDDCWYIIHNCDGSKYPPERTLTLQVYTDDVLGRKVEKLNEWTYWQEAGRVLYTCWASDLLPHEIADEPVRDDRHTNIIHWIGTIGAGRFGNINEIEGLRRACTRLGWRFVQHTGISRAQHVALIRESMLAPAVTGTWQTQNNYVPCRVFKGVSYAGHPPVTNNAKIRDIFDGQCVYHENPEELLDMRATYDVPRRWAIAFVKEHHTYVHRIQSILRFL